MYEADELAVLPPELLPDSLGSLMECLAQGQATAREILQPLMESHQWDPIDLAPIARNVLERVRAICGTSHRIESDPAETSMNRENDKALYIFRTSAVPVWALLNGAVQTYTEFLDELVTAGTDLTGEEVGCIHLQFTVIFSVLSGRIAHYQPEQKPQPLSITPLNSGRHDPLRRWVRGHHAFMVFIQWQVVFFQCFQRSADQPGDPEQACELLKLLILSMRASLQVFRFTGEFSKEAYAEVVRPTLMPPAAPEGMSGLNWRDHQFLLKCFAKSASHVVDSDLRLRGYYAMLKEQMRRVYDAHKYVCARCVGEDAASLLSKTSAVAIIDRLKEQRLRLL